MRTRPVARDKRTGRFTKAAERDEVAVEEVRITPHEATVARGRRGRFIKRDTARRHPDRTTVEKIERGKPAEAPE